MKKDIVIINGRWQVNGKSLLELTDEEKHEMNEYFKSSKTNCNAKVKRYTGFHRLLYSLGGLHHINHSPGHFNL